MIKHIDIKFDTDDKYEAELLEYINSSKNKKKFILNCIKEYKDKGSFKEEIKEVIEEIMNKYLANFNNGNIEENNSTQSPYDYLRNIGAIPGEQQDE